MGVAYDYACTSCGHVAECVTEDFDCGMDLQMFTPVVCAEHGIAWGNVGQRWLDGDLVVKDSYPCEECGRMSPRWDRVTCPACGNPTMTCAPGDGVTMWD